MASKREQEFEQALQVNRNKKKKEEKDYNTRNQEIDAALKSRGVASKTSVDEEYIKSYVKDTSDYLNSAQNDYKKVGYGNSGEYRKQYSGKAQDMELDYRAKRIREYLDNNKDNIDTETYTELSSYLDDSRQAISSTSQYFSDSDDFYSQFKTEKDYNDYLKSVEEREKLTSYDLVTGEKDINRIEAELANLQKEKNAYDNEYKKNGGYIPSTSNSVRPSYAQVEPYKEWSAQSSAYQKKIDALEGELSKKKAFHNRAKHIQTADSLYNTAIGSEDFDTISLKGKDNEIAQKRNEYEAKYGESFGDDYEFGEASLSLEDRFAKYATDEEMDIYSYYVGKGDTVSAQAFLVSMEETINARKAVGMHEDVGDNLALQYAFGAAAGVQQFGVGWGNLFSDKDYFAPTATQMASSAVREDLADDDGGTTIKQIGYDLINTTGNMMPSILASSLVSYATGGVALGGAVGSISLGASAAGNAYAEMINLGYDKGQARAYSALVGGSEAGLQYLFGGVGKLGGKLTGKSVGAVVNNVDNAFAKAAIKYGGNMLSEGFEEYAQEILDPFFKNIAFNESNEINLFTPEALYSGVLGALSAGFLEGVPGAVNAGTNALKTYQTGKNLTKSKDFDVSRLVELGHTLSADSVAYKIADKINENTGAYTIGKLFHSIGAELTAQNKADIVKSLTRKGVAESNANTIAEWLSAVVDGAKLTKTQIKALELNEDIANTFRDVVINKNSTFNQRRQAFFEAGGIDGYTGIDTQAVSQANTPDAIAGRVGARLTVPQKSSDFESQLSQLAHSTANGEDANASSSENTPFIPFAKQTAPVMGTEKIKALEGVVAKEHEASSDEGKTILKNTNEEVSIKKIASTNGKAMSLELTDGRVVSSKDVSYGTRGEALVYETIANMEVPVDVANTLVSMYSPHSGQSAVVFAKGIEEAYRYGYFSIPKAEMLSRASFAPELTEKQREDAYKLGSIMGKKDSKKSPKTAGKRGAVGKGKVHFDGDRENLKPQQKAALDALDVIAEVTGMQIEVFESSVVNDIRVGENGSYDPTTGVMRIDLHAGISGNGLMLFTAAHELTHHIKNWSPAKFKVLADFLMEQYAEKGVSVDSLVVNKRDKMAKAKANRDKISYNEAFESITYEDAYEEVIADSMETMLADGAVIEKLKLLANKDKSLVREIKSFLKDLVNKIKEAYAKLTPDSDEGKLVAKMVDATEDLHNLFVDALMDATENYTSAESDFVSIDKASESASPKLSDRDSAYMTAVESGDMETAQKMVDEAAKAAGYNSPMLYHGTQSFGFTEFDLSRMDDKRSIFLTSNNKIASTYSGISGTRKVSASYSKDIDGMKLEKVTDELNALSDEYYKGALDYRKYTYIDTKYSNELISTVNDGIDALQKNVSSILNQYKNNGKIYLQLFSLNDKLKRYEYQNLSTPIYMLLHHTDVFAEKGKEIAELEKNIRLLNEIRFLDVSEGYVVREMLDGYSLDLLDETEARDELKYLSSKGNYSMYAKSDNPLVIDGKGQLWRDIRHWASALELKKEDTRVERRDDEYYLVNQKNGDFIEEGSVAVNSFTEEMPKERLHTFMLNKANQMLRIQTEGIYTTREIAKFAKERGYDSVLFKNILDNGGMNSDVEMSEAADIYVYFSPNQIKSADPVTYDNEGNVIPLSKRFNSSKNDIRYSNRDSEGNVLSEGQQEYFKDSKVRDENGNLKVVYHGTPDGDFNTFKLPDFFSTMMAAQGAGYYFTDKANATQYTKALAGKKAGKAKLFETYLNIKNPLVISDGNGVITKQQIIDIISKGNREWFFNSWINTALTTGTPKTRLSKNEVASLSMNEKIDRYAEKISKYQDQDILAEMTRAFKGEAIIEAMESTFGTDGVKYTDRFGDIWVAWHPEQIKEATNKKPTSNLDVRYSVREIVGEDGTNYGLGVYLDSQELAILSEEERENAVINHIKKLGGHPFSAFDNDDNEVKIKVAPNTRYETEKGSRERANRHLINFLANKEKQESLMLIDEIIGSATFKGKEPATKAHGWLDNNGKNEWDVWTTYIQDKENTIWVAKLKIANTTNGEKVLYDVHPIEKVGQGRTLPTIPTDNKIPRDITESQEKFSDREIGYGKLTQGRIDYLIKDSGAGSRVDYARSWIANISPSDFINLTISFESRMKGREAFDERVQGDHGNVMGERDYIADLQNSSMMPRLSVDIDTGRVVGHDGRHRMRALEMAGARWTPVEIEFYKDGYLYKGNDDDIRLESIDLKRLTSQFDEEFYKQTHGYIHDIIPLNEDHRAEIEREYLVKKTDIRFSNAIAYSDRDIATMAETAEKHFGTTNDVRESGYITVNGKMLDFSGRHWGGVNRGSRQVDHEDIGEILPDDFDTFAITHKGDVNRNGLAKYEFEKYGNIRTQPETGSIELAMMPTDKQKSALVHFFKRMRALGEDTLRVDINDLDKNGKLFPVAAFKYDRGTSADMIVLDIEEYYKRGKLPEGVTGFSESIKKSWMFSDRDPDSTSPRNLLANALEGTVQNDVERKKLAEYKNKIDLMNAEEEKLTELRKQIKEASFSKGKRDSAKLKQLKEDATKTANRINTYDRQLLSLESTTALKNVLEREKKKATERQKQKDKEILAEYRKRAEQKQQDIIDRYQESRKKATEGRHKTEMRNKIKKVVSELNQYLLHGTKDKHVMIGMQKAVAEALSIVNMDTVGADDRVARYDALIAEATDPDVIESLTASRDRIKGQGDRLSEKLTSLQTAYSNIKDSTDPLVANAYDDVIESKIASVADTVGNTPLRDMSMSQLESVYDLYKMVLTNIRNANKLFKAEKQATIEEIGINVDDEIKEVTKQKDRILPIMDFARKMGYKELKPIYFFRMLGSKTMTSLYESVRDGQNTWYRDAFDAKTFRMKTEKEYGYKKWDFKKKHSFEAKSGKTFDLTLSQIMSIYAFSRREQALDHLIKGGIVYDDAVKVKEKKKGIPLSYVVNTSDAFNLSEVTLGEIIDTLSPEQKAFVETMQAYLSDTMGEKGNEVSLELYGVKMFKEKNYFPLKSSQYYMAFTAEEAGEVKIKNSSFSKETVKHANNPIVLSDFMDVWTSHVNDMAMYHAFVLPLEDFTRVYNYRTPTGDNFETTSIKSTIHNHFTESANEYIRQLLKDINGGSVSGVGTQFVDKMIGLAKKGAVFASASVVVQQPSAIARAMAYVNPKYFANFSAFNFAKHNRLWEECKRYAPIAGIKEMGYFDTSVGQTGIDWIKSDEYETRRERFFAFLKDGEQRGAILDDALSKAPAMADELSWVALWEAVKKETKKTTDLKVGSEEFLEHCGKRFTEVIDLTQVYDSVFSRSELMRSKDRMVKTATAFLSEPTTQVNMLFDATLQVKRRGKKGLGVMASVVGSVVASVIVNSMLKSVVLAGRDDDEGETFLEKYIASFTGDVLNGMNPLTLIPFVKDIISIFQGYSVERMDMSVIDKLISSVLDFGKDTKSDYEKWAGLIGSVGQLFGVPVKNIIRDFNTAVNTFNTLTNGNETTKTGVKVSVEEGLSGTVTALIADKLAGVGFDTSKGKQYYDAVMSGDTAHASRIIAGYGDAKKADSAIVESLKNYEPRVTEAAQAQINGDNATRIRLAKEIIADGFKQDYVVKAINGMVTKLNKGEGNAYNPKAQSLYTKEDYFDAAYKGNTFNAKTYKEEILRVEMENNGKTREEAEKSFNNSFRSSVEDAVLAGELTADKATKMLTTFGGLDEDTASEKAQYYVFKRENPRVKYNWQSSTVADYNEVAKPNGINVAVFDDYLVQKSECTGTDNNGDGKTDSGSKKSQVLAVIDSLPISSSQKDVLYRMNGWAESKLYEAPWH